MGTYWNSNGKYQKFVDEKLKTIPDMYFTDNEYMNLFIEINNLYYDIYNNGGCNFRLDKVTRIKSVIKNFKISKAISDYDYLEEITDRIFEYLMDKDLTFENYGFWNEWKNSLISLNKHEGENWSYITCGTKDNMKKEFKIRQDYGFTVV
jgi:hypothetical protein